MLYNSILAFLAASLLLPTGSATPLVSEKVNTDAITLAAATENPAIAFGTYTDRSCSGGQHDHHNPDDGCHVLPGRGMKVWWFADTCHAFIYKGLGCSPASWKIQIHVGQCYDTVQYHTIKVFCQ